MNNVKCGMHAMHISNYRKTHINGWMMLYMDMFVRGLWYEIESKKKMNLDNCNHKKLYPRNTFRFAKQREDWLLESPVNKEGDKLDPIHEHGVKRRNALLARPYDR